MYYGIKVVKSPDRDVFVVTCRDLPECTYEDPTLEGAVTAAAQCVPGVMELLYRQKRRAIPLPSPLQDACRRKFCSGTTWSKTVTGSQTSPA